MSNILLIKHGSLGDVVQASGVIQDIKNYHKNDKLFILTSPEYINFFKQCPYIDNVLVDERKSRLNIFYLLDLKKKINSLNFLKIYDLQNSRRTNFYKKYLFKSNWSSAKDIKDNNLNDPVLVRFEKQLKVSGIKTKHTLRPDLSWMLLHSSDYRINTFKKYVLLLPFCSKKLQHKKWPYFKEFIQILKSSNLNLDIVVAPGPGEEKEAENFGVTVATHNNKFIDLFQLASLIKNSFFVVANDTGPAHMAAHLGVRGVVLFGSHTSPDKVSIEREKFIALQVDDLKSLTADKVFGLIKSSIMN